MILMKLVLFDSFLSVLRKKNCSTHLKINVMLCCAFVETLLKRLNSVNLLLKFWIQFVHTVGFFRNLEGCKWPLKAPMCSLWLIPMYLTSLFILGLCIDKSFRCESWFFGSFTSVQGQDLRPPIGSRQCFTLRMCWRFVRGSHWLVASLWSPIRRTHVTLRLCSNTPFLASVLRSPELSTTRCADLWQVLFLSWLFLSLSLLSTYVSLGICQN